MRPKPSLLVVNADDFGLSPEVNGAIAAALSAGMISSTSLLTNLPAFAEAADLARAPEWSGRVGIHLNLSEGPSLTPAIRECARICRDGALAMQPSTRFRLAPEETHAVREELEAQIRRGLDAGIRPTHLDSHGHTHTQWPVAGIVIALARRFGIRAVRLSRNRGPSPGAAKLVYKSLLNARLGWAGLAAVRYFGSVRDLESLSPATRGPIEAMVHPVPGEGGALWDRSESPEPLAAALERLPAPHRLVGFGELTARSA